jgi:hypothetical protein
MSGITLANSVELRRVNREGSFCPNDVIRLGNLLVHRPLSSDSLLDLLVGPATGAKACQLGFSGTRDTNHGVEFRLRVSLKKERDDHYAKRKLPHAPLFDLRLPQLSNPRVEDRFQFLAGYRIAENPLCHEIAPKASGIVEQFGAEYVTNFGQRRLAWLDDLPRQLVRIDDCDSALSEQIGTGGFSHADSAGDAKHLHT